MFKIGSPLDRHCTPWNTLGKNPLPQSALPNRGMPLDNSTKNPGKLSFSLPNPHVVQAPIEGFPLRADPLCTNNCAGPWLN